MKIYLKENLMEKRYIHTLGVAETAKKLAKLNGVSEEKAEIAGLAHDVAKNLSIEKMKNIIEQNGIILSKIEENNPSLWHSIIAHIEAKDKLKIEDEEILDAIRWHTTGKENMSTLTKIIYIADMIEPGRKFEGVEELRKVTFEDLDKGVYAGLNGSLKVLLVSNLLIDDNTIKARNYFLFNSNVKA
jgi:predicted HD superfamily hydrolase involved in NAD metabolism